MLSNSYSFITISLHLGCIHSMQHCSATAQKNSQTKSHPCSSFTAASKRHRDRCKEAVHSLHLAGSKAFTTAAFIKVTHFVSKFLLSRIVRMGLATGKLAAIATDCNMVVTTIMAGNPSWHITIEEEGCCICFLLSYTIIMAADIIIIIAGAAIADTFIAITKAIAGTRVGPTRHCRVLRGLMCSTIRKSCLSCHRRVSIFRRTS
jgi:hypothetical protein